MKKFLSLVLAMIMALSLVTVSAGATEYADLTDVDEIQYEEAVAVLNKIGIITGYEDGSFRPTGELTRGAAAKIIVGLLIGPEAAENLTVATAPYPDVPVTNTFAAVISYCKTAGIISGYSDGTFKPTGSLTGYAFSKMLLGALGYRSDIEGFTGSGYTMNVARVGNAAGLFNRLSFQGGETVNRETACQLALNTLKATMVEYSGGFNITTGDATVTGAQTRSYVVSNQEYARNISNRKADGSQANNAGGDTFTVEFGEEHFKDLRMDREGDARDDFGRPSTKWSWKMVTFGTFPLEPDFVFTSQVIKRDDNPSDAAKIRALGMNGFSLAEDGDPDDVDTELYVNGNTDYELEALADIADLTDNGTLVEAYIDLDNDDFIKAVVVIQSELMEVKKIGADYVSLQKYKDNEGPDIAEDTDLESEISDNGDERYAGFNQAPINVDVDDVEVEDGCYEFLSGLKAGDRVVIIPVTADDGDSWQVGDAYKPETVSGSLTRVDTYAQKGNTSSERSVTGMTVGGTKYDTSLWNKKIIHVSATDISVTKKDVTLTLDAYGYALLAEDVGSTNDYIVISNFYQEAINRKIVNIVEGFDMDGNKVELNVGTDSSVKDGLSVGDLVRYTNSGTLSSGAEWNIYTQENTGGGDSAKNPLIYEVNHGKELKKSNTRITLLDPDVTLESVTPDYADGVKFVYVNFRDESEVESVTILKGAQDVTSEELHEKGASGYQAQAYLKDGTVRAVVIKDGGTLSSNVLYVVDKTGFEGIDDDGNKIYGYKAAVVNGNDFDDDAMIAGDLNLKNGDFATWSDTGETISDNGKTLPIYTMRKLDETKKATSAAMATIVQFGATNGAVVRVSNYLVNNSITASTPNGTAPANGINLNLDEEGEADIWGDAEDALKISTTNWVNQSGQRSADSAKGLKNYLDKVNGDTTAVTDGNSDEMITARLRFVFNDKVGDGGFRTANLVVVDAIDTWDALTNNAEVPEYEDPDDIEVPLNAEEDIDPEDETEELDLDVDVQLDKVVITADEQEGTEGNHEGKDEDIDADVGVQTQDNNALNGANPRAVTLMAETMDGYTTLEVDFDFVGYGESVGDKTDYIQVVRPSLAADLDRITEKDISEMTSAQIKALFSDYDEVYTDEAGTEEVASVAELDTEKGYAGLYYVQVENDGSYTYETFNTFALATAAVEDETGDWFEGTIYVTKTNATPSATDLEELEDEIETSEVFETCEEDPNEGLKLYVLDPITTSQAGQYKVVISADTVRNTTGDAKILKWKVVLTFKGGEDTVEE